MQPLQICIDPIIRIGRDSWCLPYAGFFSFISILTTFQQMLTVIIMGGPYQDHPPDEESKNMMFKPIWLVCWGVRPNMEISSLCHKDCISPCL